MCAIVGSSSASKFEILYEVNLPRGNFASGVVLLHDYSTQEIMKQEGSFDFNKDPIFNGANYYFGHVQAPTSANREWSKDTSHPFIGINWMVMHNGVLTNDKKLKKMVPWDENPVDTSRILQLLQAHCNDSVVSKPKDQINIISSVLSLLEGSYAVCIVNRDTNNLYIARQGSVLHYNKKGDFSTLKGKDFIMLEEGVILKKTPKTWRKAGTFETNSPFIFV